ncbi:trypsin-1-like isoform X2 [Penaeus chinensis]|uniref:trypsin-1-like isoform X2 n=1 Tax=Penaeus chinensis TaxID=139456 RepID=UPI001FB6AFEF|nr:trypsin-1-like isoform X2 [Penaeus chinensis]
MVVLVLFLLFMTEVSVESAVTPTYLQRLRSPRIVGGEDAFLGEFPFQVSIEHVGFLGRNHICGGIVVTANDVLTAAHCISKFSEHNIDIVTGVNSLSDTSSDRQTVQAAHFVIHDDFNDITMESDIAIIKLRHSLTLGERVQPVAMPKAGETALEGETCTVVGWGATFENGDLSDVLQKVSVPIQSDNYCRSAYGYSAVEDTMLCAGSPEGGVDACEGDRGGPLLCRGHLHGISSWGQGCGHSFYPGVYTEVSAFLYWILQHTMSE